MVVGSLSAGALCDAPKPSDVPSVWDSPPERSGQRASFQKQKVHMCKKPMHHVLMTTAPFDKIPI